MLVGARGSVGLGDGRPARGGGLRLRQGLDLVDDQQDAALLGQAVAKQQAGDPAGARALFDKLVKIAPKDETIRYDYGVLLQQQNDDAGALEQYNLVLAVDPDNVGTLFNAAVIYGRTNPAAAIANYEKILTLRQNAPTSYLNLGLLEAGTGSEPQGIKDLTTAITQDPSLVSQVPPTLLAKVQAASRSTGASPSASPKAPAKATKSP